MRFPRAVSQTAPGRPRVTARPALRPVSAERGRLRQVAEGNARMRRVSGSAGLSAEPMSGCVRRGEYRGGAPQGERARSANEWQHSFARRAPGSAGHGKKRTRLSALRPLHFIGACWTGFLEACSKPRMPRRIARTRACIRPRDSAGGGPPEGWWRGLLNRRFVVGSEQSSSPTPRPPHFVRSPSPLSPGGKVRVRVAV